MNKRLDTFLALRLIADSKLQSLLTMLGIAVGVAVVVYLSALIEGLQADLLKRTLGSQPHLSIVSTPSQARPLWQRRVPNALTTRVVSARPERRIDNWRQIRDELTERSDVIGVAAINSQPGFSIRGGKTLPVLIQGADPQSFSSVIPLEERMVAGSYSFRGEGIVIGQGLATELETTVGDLVRIRSADRVETTMRVVGIFSLGVAAADDSWVLVGEQRAQALTTASGSVTRIDVRLRDPFYANSLASQLRKTYPHEVETWMDNNQELLTALRSQSMSTILIEVFVMVAVAIGVASVLVVSVYQRKREIGILRAIGVTRSVVLRVFLLQGTILGLVGAVLGLLLGLGIALLFQATLTSESGEPLFSMYFGASLFVKSGAVAVATGVLASFIPARRASRLLPVEAIRQ